MLGFKDAAYFNRFFTRQWMPPARYRRDYIRRDVAGGRRRYPSRSSIGREDWRFWFRCTVHS